jgi:hypothetical protein
MPLPDAAPPLPPAVVPPWPDTNNAAFVIDPAVIGDAPLVRKTVPVVTTEGHPDFAIGESYAVPSAGDGLKLLVPITNVGAVDHCLVALRDIVYLDASGNQVGAVNGNSFIQGAIRVLSNFGMSTDSCLGPGETGWVLAYGSSYDSIASVQAALRASNEPVASPGLRVHPVSYSVNDQGLLTITFQNEGTEGVTLYLGSWIGFDEEGVPVVWDLLSAGGMYLDPGATGTAVRYLPSGVSFRSIRARLGY